jgi:hypothetical protein
MLLKLADLEAIRVGRIDLVFRRWSRPTVKAGGTLKTRLGILHIGRIDDLTPEDVTEADARRAGFAGLPAFHRWLATMKPGTLFQRIEIGYAEPHEGQEEPR